MCKKDRNLQIYVVAVSDKFFVLFVPGIQRLFSDLIGERLISKTFFTDRYDYRIGTKKEIEDGIIQQIRLFNMDIDTSEEIVRKSPQYRRIAGNTKGISDIRSLESSGAPIYKIFIFAADVEQLEKLSDELRANPAVAVASSFIYNQEVTAVEAQKGPVLKEYIEALGYTMDEVMVLGDSLNDYSMLSMDFGATVAMENADEEVKRVSKYVTKSNEDLGVAYTIHELLKKQGKINSNW